MRLCEDKAARVAITIEIQRGIVVESLVERGFHMYAIDAPLVIQLCEMSRVDDDLAENMNRLTNRLRDQLHRFYPALLRLSPSADEPWLWALLELAPTPAAGARLKLRHAKFVIIG